jgi:hypothetical protein
MDTFRACNITILSFIKSSFNPKLLYKILNHNLIKLINEILRQISTK